MIISDALKKVKADSKEKFDATIELHINLNTKPQEQFVRFSTTLPHGTGKDVKVAVYASKKIANADIELTDEDLVNPKINFDILISEPKLMAKLASAAKILGPAGVMPSPKNGTVTEDVEKTVELFKKGKIEVKNEQNAPVIHTILGKVSFSDKNLEENYNEILSTLKQNKPQKAKPDWIQSATICTSMGKSVIVDL